jgi:hypothetical protein
MNIACMPAKVPSGKSISFRVLLAALAATSILVFAREAEKSIAGGVHLIKIFTCLAFILYCFYELKRKP